MNFTSTRNSAVIVTGMEAILQGISIDGGLFVPSEIPKAGAMIHLLDMDYKALAFYIMGKYLTDFSAEDLAYCIDSAYDSKFSNSHIAPVRKTSDRYFIELFHGPTAAFKDMALSILPYFITTAMKRCKLDKEVVILTATSGDTGKAALEGFKNVPGTKIAVFFPEKGVSNIQKRQMQTQEGNNVLVLGVEGNFDDCQNTVKEIFTDPDFNHKLHAHGMTFSSANSINIGRLIPQIVYYIYAYTHLLKYGEINEGEKVNIVVPTGNFGNILAAFYAMNMGLPVHKLICASNENNVLTDFIKTGIYDRIRDLHLTTSPSMDILISSNLERFLYHLLDGDSDQVLLLMKELKEKGRYQIDLAGKIDFLDAGYATEAEVKDKILQTFLDEKYIIDTHTAVASVVYDKYQQNTKDYTKTIIASTASPYKFATSVLEALGFETNENGDFAAIHRLAGITGTIPPKNILDLESKALRFVDYYPVNEIKSKLSHFLLGE